MSKTVLVVAAHADDEALGCGRAIARHVAEGDRVHLVLMADGVKSRPEATSVELERRNAATVKAQRILGIERVYSLGFPDNRMDSVPLLEIVQALEPIVEHVSPQVIYTHYHGDLNVDHRRTQAAVMTACRPQPGCTVREIYGFEVLSSSEWATPQTEPFSPTMFADISANFSVKLLAFEAYADEMRSAPHSRSLEHVTALARHRGYSVGLEAAEAFMVYRLVR